MPDIEVGGKALVSQSGTADPVIKSNVNFTGVINSTATGTFTGDVNASSTLGTPTGTTAQRPSSPSLGHLRYNSDFNKFEHYNGIGWLNESNSYNPEQGGLVFEVDAKRPLSTTFFTTGNVRRRGSSRLTGEIPPRLLPPSCKKFWARRKVPS